MTAPSLTGKDRRYLRSLAHAEVATLVVGRGGVTPPVLHAIEELFNRRELVKIRLNLEDAAARRAAAADIAAAIGAALVGVLGKTAALYRPAPADRRGPRIALPER